MRVLGVGVGVGGLGPVEEGLVLGDIGDDLGLAGLKDMPGDPLAHGISPATLFLGGQADRRDDAQLSRSGVQQCESRLFNREFTFQQGHGPLKDFA